MVCPREPYTVEESVDRMRLFSDEALAWNSLAMWCGAGDHPVNDDTDEKDGVARIYEQHNEGSESMIDEDRLKLIDTGDGVPLSKCEQNLYEVLACQEDGVPYDPQRIYDAAFGKI